MSKTTKNNSKNRLIVSLLPLLLSFFISSCASVSAPDKRDPWESYNRSIYSFNDTFDKAIARPVAETYKNITPDFIETGVSNFFSNLNEVSVITNDILQFKIGQALSDLARFVANSTIGVLGLFDVATPMGLPKHNEDFGQTLAVWGINDGPYFVLPFLGPSTVRDSAGLVVDSYYLNPITYIEDDEARWGVIALRAIDTRAGLLEETRLMEKSGIDPYVFMRNAYFQIRLNQIHDGKPPATIKIKAKEETEEDRRLREELEKELQL